MLIFPVRLYELSESVWKRKMVVFQFNSPTPRIDNEKSSNCIQHSTPLRVFWMRCAYGVRNFHTTENHEFSILFLWNVVFPKLNDT